MHNSPATPASVLTGGIVARHSEMSVPALAVSSALPEMSCPSLRAHARLGVEGGAGLLSAENGFKDGGMEQPPTANDSKTVHEAATFGRRFLKSTVSSRRLSSCTIAFEVLRNCIDPGPVPLWFADGVATETVCFGLPKPRAARFDNGSLDVNRRQRVKA